MIGLVGGAVVSAHGFAGSSGWLHPLTGWDHVLAMVAVGLWSAQLGGRALWSVPTWFVAAMATGVIAGAAGVDVRGVEVLIAGSVLLLGLALALRVRTAVVAAGAAVALFGLCHGIVHGHELSGGGWSLIGVLMTTAALHAAGAVAGLLSLESRFEGRALRWAGWAAAAMGVGLLVSAT